MMPRPNTRINPAPVALGIMRCLLAAGLLAAVGCGEDGPKVVQVSGRVTYQGEPIVGGVVREVIFVPLEATAEGRLQPAVGLIADDGTFSMQAFASRQGILPGRYAVAIDIHQGSHMQNDVRYLIPEKYVKAATSDLQVDVPADKSSIETDFDLK